MGASRQRKPYTGFGKTLRMLMLDRNIRSWTQLEEEIDRATGERYSHQSMSKYAAGTSTIPPEFVQAFANTLELTSSERSELAEQFTYYSRPADEEQESA